MRRGTWDASEEEIDAIQGKFYPDATCEFKLEDWGHVDGRLVVFDYGYACDNEGETLRQRAEYAAYPDR